ncbi:O-methyltransferase [Sciscionella marina]|uniref:O-methyltransferase n=1 Tax=Sciscionella marina TaxID=508770 RepID=UPI00037D8673|nr:O-methyltransferase [Sciscionella marina]
MRELWSQVDQFIDGALIDSDPAAPARAAAENAGLPPIAVTAGMGKFLSLIAGSIGARSVLEIGTLAGYSTIWFAEGIGEQGRVVTLEADPRHAELAWSNLQAAGVADRVRLEVGPALDALPKLEAESIGPFDLVFIDADRRNNPEYLGWALRLSRVGTVIIVDNVVRAGAILDEETEDPDIQGVRGSYELLAAHPRIEATALQTVSGKNYDGFIYAVVRR